MERRPTCRWGGVFLPEAIGSIRLDRESRIDHPAWRDREELIEEEKGALARSEARHAGDDGSAAIVFTARLDDGQVLVISLKPG
jgi:hypothetical protein